MHSVYKLNGELSHNRNERYCQSKCTISESIINQPEPFSNIVTNLNSDLDSFIARSDPLESDFLRTLVSTHSSAVSLQPNDIGHISNPAYFMDIELKDPSSTLPLDLPFPTNPINKIASQRIVDSWIDAGIAVPSSIRTHGSRLTIAKKHINPSDFTSIKNRLFNELNISIEDQSELFKINPTLLTDQEIGKSYRQCLDARNLNALIKNEFVCSPSSESVLTELLSMGSETPSMLKLPPPPPSSCPDLSNFLSSDDLSDDKLYMSMIDIKSAHNSLILTPRASSYLNCILPNYSTIQFVKSPFGLVNVNSTFNRVMSDILKDLIKARLVLIYADDLILLCRGRVQHRRLLQNVFKLFQDNGVKLSINKCSSFVTNYNFLGFKFTEEGLFLTDERMKTISKLLPPNDLKGVQPFLGSTQYIARFIPDLQTLLLPITPLLNKNAPFIWGPPQQIAFDQIKTLIASNLKLNFIDSSLKLYLYCDASQWAGGGVLYQQIPPSNLKRPVAFFSRKFNPNQSRLYSSLELELLNLVDNVGRAQLFADLNAHPLTVVTDAKNVLFLLRSQASGPNPKLIRLAGRLANFNTRFELCYEKPTANPEFLIADFISRSFDPPNADFTSIPMSTLRKITGDDINHDLTPGSSFTFQELSDLAIRNDHWFKNFPPPLPTIPPTYLEPSLSEFPLPTSTPDQTPCIHPINETFSHLTSPLPEFEPKILINHLSKINFSLTPDGIIPFQRSDPFLSVIIKDLETNYDDNSPNPDHYFLHNLALHKLKDTDLPPSPANSTLVLPESFLPNLIGHFHLAYGHLGIERLTALISSMYSASTKVLGKYIKSLILGCHLCQLAKISTKRLPPISPTPLPLYPMQTLSLDYFSVPPSHGYKYILLAIDRFSGFIYIRQCKSEGSTEVVALLTQIFSSVGPALTVTSDNGTTLFRNRNVKKFLSTWGVTTVSLSLPYSPIHNARAERAIKSYRNLLRLYTHGNENKWSEVAEKLTYMHNSTPRLFTLNKKKILISPFELFLRRKPKPIFINSSLISDPSAQQFFSLEEEKLKQLETFVLDFQKKENLLYQTERNKFARAPNFHVGDVVLLKNLSPPRKNEMPLKYLAPYKNNLYLVHHIKDLLCVLYDPVSGRILYHNTTNVKKYHPRGDLFAKLSPDLQRMMGSPFDPTSQKTRAKLISYLNDLQMNQEAVDSFSTVATETNIKKISSDHSAVPPSHVSQMRAYHVLDNISGYSSTKAHSLAHASSLNLPTRPPSRPPPSPVHPQPKFQVVKSGSILGSLRKLPSRLAKTISKFNK